MEADFFPAFEIGWRLNDDDSFKKVDTVTNKRPLGRLPIHPGEILREDVLPALGLSVSEAARRLGISRQQFHRILAGTHPITTEMALRIGKFTWNGPALWLRLQQAYDLWHAERQMKNELSKIEPVAPVGIGV